MGIAILSASVAYAADSMTGTDPFEQVYELEYDPSAKANETERGDSVEEKAEEVFVITVPEFSKETEEFIEETEIEPELVESVEEVNTLPADNEGSLSEGAEPEREMTSEQKPEITVREEVVEMDLDNPVTVNQNGSCKFEHGDLLDFVFPSRVGEVELTSIGADAFNGCPVFRTVIIPCEITEIGDNAFANCENLERIILLGRKDADGMVLGENWSGNVPVVFGVVEIPEDTSVED